MWYAGMLGYLLLFVWYLRLLEESERHEPNKSHISVYRCVTWFLFTVFSARLIQVTFHPYFEKVVVWGYFTS